MATPRHAREARLASVSASNLDEFRLVLLVFALCCVSWGCGLCFVLGVVRYQCQNFSHEKRLPDVTLDTKG